jgi:hypothetical protein
MHMAHIHTRLDTKTPHQHILYELVVPPKPGSVDGKLRLQHGHGGHATAYFEGTPDKKRNKEETEKRKGV